MPESHAVQLTITSTAELLVYILPLPTFPAILQDRSIPK